MTARGRVSILPLAVVAGLLAGCGGSPSTLSPTSLEDPARAERARRQIEEVEQANREAEARFFRQARAAEIMPELEPRPEADSSTNDVTVASH